MPTARMSEIAPSTTLTLGVLTVGEGPPPRESLDQGNEEELGSPRSLRIWLSAVWVVEDWL